MMTNIFFFHFDTKTKPGTIIATGVRFQQLEIAEGNFDETNFKILCEQHEELKNIPLSAFKEAVASNFPSR